MRKSKKITPKQYTELAAGIRISQHEKLCAERMNRLIKNIDELRKDVAELKDNVSRGKGIVAVLVFLGSITAAIIGVLSWK
tara:strand:- start:20 stop:262 length:243 start_codon:yes stop_codon:yes gene_type:complete